MARYLGVLLIVLLLVLSAVAQKPTDTAKPAPAAQQTPIPTEPSVVISVPDAAKVVAWRDVRLQYAIVNGTAGIGVNSLTISVPSSMAVTSGTIGRAPDGSLKVITSGFHMRTPGERKEFSPIELRAKFLAEMRTQLFSLLTYRAQKETVVATLEYSPLNSPETTYTRTATLQLNITPNPAGIYIGALVGALLIALLIPFSRIVRQLSQGEAVSRKLWLEFETFVARFIRGAIAGAIAVLVLQTTSDFNFPISVGIQDFYGGVILGLLGDKVTEQIMSKAGVSDGKPAQQPATPIKAQAA